MKTYIIKNLRQIIFTVAYLIIALFISSMIYKGNLDNFHTTFEEVPFDLAGTNYTSRTFSFPASNQLVTINYSCTHDTDIIIRADSLELAVIPAPAGEWMSVSQLFYVPKATSTYTISFANSSADDTIVHSIDVLSDQLFNTDGTVKAIIAFVVMILFLALILCYRNKIIELSTIIPIIILSAFCLFVSSPLMLDYIPYGHDLWCHVGRIEGFKDALIDGQLFPVIIPDAFNGFGILGFEYPSIFLYIPGLIRLNGASMTLSYQVFLFCINIATAFVSYHSLKSVIRHCSNDNTSIEKINGISLICAITYLMSSYRLSDMYIRAASGETIAMIFLPLIITGLYHICIGQKQKWYILAIGLTGIMQSHILSCILIIPVIIVLILPFIRSIISEKRIPYFFYTVGAFLIANLWYIIPFVRFYLLPLNSEALLKYKDYVSYNVVKFSRLFTATVGTGFKDGEDFTLSIGITSLVVLIICAIYLYMQVKNSNRSNDLPFRFMLTLTVEFVIFLFLSSELFPWEYLKENHPLVEKLVDTIQFPYRFLTLTTICLVFMLAIALTKMQMDNKILVPILFFVVGLAIYDSSALIEGYRVSGFESVSESTGGFKDHLPEDYLPADLDMATLDNITASINDGVITEYSRTGTNITFSYASDVDTCAYMPLLYYPCYKAKIDGSTKANVLQNDSKTIAIALPSGSHTVQLKVSLYP